MDKEISAERMEAWKYDFEYEEMIRQSEGLYDEHVWAWAEHMSEHDENAY